MGRSGADTVQIVQLSLVLAAFACAFMMLPGREKLKRLRHLFVWAIIILLITAAYTYWPDVKNSKFYTSLVPGTAITTQNGELEFQKAEDGHYYIDAMVNNKTIHFMVDTGATDIVLSQKDAEKVGISSNSLIYNKVYSTANGITRGAGVKISYLKIGEGAKAFEMQDFYASVNQGELENSLLGMKFLERFKSYNFEGQRLVLKP